ncbi:hypothetical protein WJX79_005585 [Trebouxia sp. C0005]
MTLYRSAVVSAAGLAVLLVVVLTGTPIGQYRLSDVLSTQLQRCGMADSRHVRLNSGYIMPLLGWGSSGARDTDAVQAVKAAIKAGFRHIDDAEMYGNEEAIGQGIQELIRAGNVKRKDLFIVSKLGNNHHAPDAVLPAVQASLSKLQLKYLDLYHIHWPNSEEAGPEVVPPFNETWAAMESLVDRGLVRSIGVSNFSPEKIQTLLETARIRPAVNQVEVHCHFRNERVIAWCKKEGIHVTAYAPLSSPQTMSSMKKTVPNLLQDAEVAHIAKKNGKTVAQTLLRWGLQHGTSVIPKSSNPKHSQDNQGAWGWTLPQEDYDVLSSKKFQLKYFDGGFVMNKKGPYKTYEDLWNEPQP